MKETPESSATSRWTLPVLGVVLLLHVILAVSYARTTPYRTAGVILLQRGAPAQDIGAPDERQHANYVQHLLDGKGTPVFNPADPNLYETYQAHQPPLYYILTAGWAKLTGTSDVSEPAQGIPLRYLNALISAGTLVGVYFLAVWGFRRPDLGVLAAATVGLLPMFVALSGAISNDPLLFLLCTWTLAVCALGITHGWTMKRSVTVGVIIGLAIVTKTTAIALIPTVLVAFWMSPQRPDFKLVMSAALPALLLAVPWWIRNVQVLEGFDPLAMNAFTKAFTGSPQASLFIEALGPKAYWLDMVGWWTARSFVGAFGYMDIFLEPTTYRLIFALLAILIAGWILASQQPQWKEHRRVQIVNVVFLVLVVALFLRFNAQYFQGQARYLYPAIAVLATGFGIGALFFTRNRAPLALGVIAIALLGLNAYILGWLPDQFAMRVG